MGSEMDFQKYPCTVSRDTAEKVRCCLHKVRLIVIYRSVVASVCGVTDTNFQDNHTNGNQDTAERVDFCECKVPLLTNRKDTYTFFVANVYCPGANFQEHPSDEIRNTTKSCAAFHVSCS